MPDLSFGTHFFQDLVESSIRYLPLYPDEPGRRLQRAVPRGARRTSSPTCCRSSPTWRDVVRVIDVPRATDGQVLRVLMNADLDEAVGRARPRRPPPPTPATEKRARGRARPTTTTGAGGCGWPSGSPRSSTPRASASRRSTSSAAPRTRPPGPRATSTCSSTSRGDDADAPRARALARGLEPVPGAR